MESYVASDGQQRVTHHTEPGGPWLIGVGITRRIIPLERTAYFRWRTAHGGFGMVDRLQYSGADLMSSESPSAMERHYGWTWMLSRNIDDQKGMRRTQCGRYL
jgi:hypothetical protein